MKIVPSFFDKNYIKNIINQSRTNISTVFEKYKQNGVYLCLPITYNLTTNDLIICDISFENNDILKQKLLKGYGVVQIVDKLVEKFTTLKYNLDSKIILLVIQNNTEIKYINWFILDENYDVIE